MITELNFKERSLLFAKLSAIAYQNPEDAEKNARALGFTTTEFYDRDGAQAYRFMNTEDIVIACRGTEPTCFNDVKADLKAIPVMSETVSRVHKGFKQEVDDLWPMVKEDLIRTVNQDKKIWFTGHSLGAAMTTIMSGRCFGDNEVPDPQEVYTYGSPRVGWSGYVKSITCEHYRWVNNNDIVCRVPFAFLGYRHHGSEMYINAFGNIRKLTYWQRVKDRWRGFVGGIKKGKIDNFSDHNITEYIKHIDNFVKGHENPKK